MSDTFFSTAFGSAIAIEAIFFAVFGFLYSVYAMYSSLATPEEPARAPITATLKRLCRILCIFVIISSLVALYALYLLNPAGLSGLLLAAGLALSVSAMVVITIWLAFFSME